MGTTNPFAKLFGKSPFKPMQEHMRIVAQCASEVPTLFKALSNNDATALEATKSQIFELENKADDIKNSLRTHLPKSLFMPVDRRDLLEILDMQDSIADTAQDIAGLLVERQMELPADMQTPLNTLSVRCVDACHQAAKIIEELDELVETGFGGRESEMVFKMIEELSQIENETDVAGMELTRTLFAHEETMKPVSVMFWYQLIQWVGDLADYSEKVGDRLRLLMAR